MLSYKQIHAQLRIDRGRATEHPCATCDRPAHEWALKRSARNIPSPDGPFSADLDDYQPMCRPCHRQMDAGDTCRAGLHPWPASAVSDGRWRTCGPCRSATNAAAHARRKAARAATA